MKQKIKSKQEKISAINLSQLRKMATTNKLRDILKNNIEHEKIPSVRTAWIEYFLDVKHKKILLNER
jgi:hypothetical protein